MFQHIPELVNRYLMPPDPVILHYIVDPAVAPPERPSAWDVETKTEDVAMKTRMTTMVQASKESAQELTKLDEDVSNTPSLILLRRVSIDMSVDRITCTIAAQLTSQTYIPSILRRGSRAVHTDLACIAIAGLRKHIGQRSK
jgi:hypothetical protein